MTDNNKISIDCGLLGCLFEVIILAMIIVFVGGCIDNGLDGGLQALIGPIKHAWESVR